MVVYTLDPNAVETRQEDHELEMSLDFLASLRSLCGCIVRPVKTEGGGVGGEGQRKLFLTTV